MNKKYIPLLIYYYVPTLFDQINEYESEYKTCIIIIIMIMIMTDGTNIIHVCAKFQINIGNRWWQVCFFTYIQ